MSRYLLGKVTELTYRPDIDGLRALAVLSVIFYHVGFAGFEGGFVGVDVFFVISGYLITRNIASEMQKGTFSFAKFYLRRARRLFPALFLTLAVSFAIGVVILAPYHQAEFAQSLVFSIIPVSNIYFWQHAGYFSSDAIVKPLLHTWSLSVEEQFYLVWPGLLILLFAMRKSWLSLVILLLAGGGSLAYAEIKLASDHNGVFFLTQYRIFEFIAGILCVWLVNHRPKNKFIQELSLASGLTLIFFAVFFYSSGTTFPGINAMPPVFGAMLVIYAGAPHLLGRLLINRVVVSIGLISYSLYLVHWPLLVFLTYQMEGKWYMPYAVVFWSFILATLMYFYVEMPFRKHNPSSVIIKTKSFVLMSVGLSFILMAASVSTWMSGGWGWRLPTELRGLSGEIAEERDKRFSVYRQLCESRGWINCSNFSAEPSIKNVVILGDSHAPDALNALYSVNQKPNYIQIGGLGGCPPMVSEDYNLLSPKMIERNKCMEINDDIFSGELLKNADLIVISVLFGWYKPENLERAIKAIQRKTEGPIWVFGNYIVTKQDLPTLLVRHPQDFLNSPDINKEWMRGDVFMFEADIKNLSHKLGFVFISKKKLLCPEAEVKPCPIFLDDGKLFTYDRHHLSVSAAVTLGRRLQLTAPQLIEALN